MLRFFFPAIKLSADLLAVAAVTQIPEEILHRCGISGAYGDTPAGGGGNFDKKRTLSPASAHKKLEKEPFAKFTAPIGLAEQLSALTFECTCDFRDMSRRKL